MGEIPTRGPGTSFLAHRAMLWGLCYRLTGCAADADDIVQDTFVRAIENAGGGEWSRAWLVKVASNLALDVLRRRRRRGYAGPWLPSPVASETDQGRILSETLVDADRSPETRYETLESVSFAFLLALEALGPKPRAVLLLRDVFGYSARETADVLAMSDANVRVVLHRARRAMESYDRTRVPATSALEESTRHALVELVRCLNAQDSRGLERLLAASVTTVTDAGGEYNALRSPLSGRDRVMTFHLRVAQRRGPGSSVDLCTINGTPAVRIEFGDSRRRAAPSAVLRCELDHEGRIRTLHSVLASRKLTAAGFWRESARV